VGLPGKPNPGGTAECKRLRLRPEEAQSFFYWSLDGGDTPKSHKEEKEILGVFVSWW
jgi:hypothetical protein